MLCIETDKNNQYNQDRLNCQGVNSIWNKEIYLWKGRSRMNLA